MTVSVSAPAGVAVSTTLTVDGDVFFDTYASTFGGAVGVSTSTAAPTSVVVTVGVA